jgi:hypothetical protein
VSRYQPHQPYKLYQPHQPYKLYQPRNPWPKPHSNLQHDFPELLAALHFLKGGLARRERENRIYDGRDFVFFDKFEHRGELARAAHRAAEQADLFPKNGLEAQAVDFSQRAAVASDARAGVAEGGQQREALAASRVNDHFEAASRLFEAFFPARFAVIRATFRAERKGFFDFFGGAGSHKNFRASGHCELERQKGYAAADARDEHFFAFFQLAAAKNGAPSRQPGEWQSGGLRVAEVRGRGKNMAARHSDLLGEGAGVGHPEHAEIFALEMGVVAPFEGGVDDHALASPLPHPIGAEDAGRADACVEALRDEKVAVVERGGAHLYDGLAAHGRGCRHVGERWQGVGLLDDECFQARDRGLKVLLDAVAKGSKIQKKLALGKLFAARCVYFRL